MRVRWIPMVEGLWIDKLYFHLLTLGTEAHLVCQAIPTYCSMPYSNMGDYEGRTWLSPPITYPSTGGSKANKGSI
jgi:hypothetical protein